MLFQGGGILTYLTYSMIGWACLIILMVLILWSIVDSWEEVAEDKPISPCPESQEDNEQGDAITRLDLPLNGC